MAFSREQIADLRQLGVIAAQLKELRRILPTCRAAIRAQRVPMSDVRDELTELHKAMQCASTALARWESASAAQTPAMAEARALVHEASFDFVEDRPAIGDAADAVSLAESVIAKALERLPKTQRRAEASPWPVYWIHEALMRGWGRAHYPVRRGEVPSSDAPGGVIPPYPHSPSSGVASRFRNIVCICYDAALGTRDNDPERAIKAFVRRRSASKRTQGRQVP